MNDLIVEDTLTKLNTQLNKSMVLMDTTSEVETLPSKSNKSIKINTEIQPARPFSTSPVTRKSILKRNERKSISVIEDSIKNTMDSLDEKNNEMISINVSSAKRPQNINDLVQEEGLITETTDVTFNADDLSDNEEIWIMDIPRTIDPMSLKGQSLTLGEKSKFKINEERYCAVSHEVKYNVTCVLNSGKVKPEYKTVNMKPAGTITVRRKLSSISKTKPMQIENCSVPFPKNLRSRHPLFGVSHKSKNME